MEKKAHAVERLWLHAAKKAGTALPEGATLPALPKLKMRHIAWALIHFAELLEGFVPEGERRGWTQHLNSARRKLTTSVGDLPTAGATMGRVEGAQRWVDVAELVHQAAHRAVYAPSLALVAQRTAVASAFTRLRKHSATRKEANEDIRRGLERLEAGCWLAAARERGVAVRPELERARGWWGGAALALFEEANGSWWLVRLPAGRPVVVEAGSRDDLLATVPDTHFAAAVQAVLRERVTAINER